MAAPTGGLAQTPPSLDPPAGNRIQLAAPAAGVQMYVGALNSNGQLAWVFVAPAATLFNNGGQQIGVHFAGPRWQANDGSTVRGVRLAGVASSDPNSVPWLLLEVVEHVGAGRFDQVSYIQRLNTVGGAAPTTPPTFVGETANVPYTATYVFFRPSGS